MINNIYKFPKEIGQINLHFELLGTQNIKDTEKYKGTHTNKVNYLQEKRLLPTYFTILI